MLMLILNFLIALHVCDYCAVFVFETNLPIAAQPLIWFINSGRVVATASAFGLATFALSYAAAAFSGKVSCPLLINHNETHHCPSLSMSGVTNHRSEFPDLQQQVWKQIWNYNHTYARYTVWRLLRPGHTWTTVMLAPSWLLTHHTPLFAALN